MPEQGRVKKTSPDTYYKPTPEEIEAECAKIRDENAVKWLKMVTGGNKPCGGGYMPRVYRSNGNG